MVGISEQLFGGLTIGFDHRLQSMAAQWIFDTIYVHSKVGLIKDKSCTGTLNVSTRKCLRASYIFAYVCYFEDA